MQITETTKPTSVAEWRRWLADNHQTQTEIWLLYDKRADVPTVSYLDSVEQALCFGWIDGLQKRFSEFENAQRFTPRKPKSNWTELNKARARRLIDLGQMTPRGLETLPDLERAFQVPDYIMQALSAVPEALQNFTALPPLYVRVRVGYIDEMRKKPDELSKRLNNFVMRTAEGKLFGNWNDGGRLDDDG